MSGTGSAVVVAHPDDEALWLSSALAAADRIVFCFGDLFERPRMSAARRAAVAALALPGLVDLALPESGGGFAIDWRHPHLTEAGIAISEPTARKRYEANYTSLVEALRPVLAGCGTVFTHNPWGEYGHAEHIQVYRAVAALQAELGYTIWFSNYAGPASWPLARQLAGEPIRAESRAVRPDIDMARHLMRIYRRHGAWTWTRAHVWPAAEMLYAQPAGTSHEGWHSLSGEWLLDVTGLRWWPPLPRKARRRLFQL